MYMRMHVQESLLIHLGIFNDLLPKVFFSLKFVLSSSVALVPDVF